MWQLSYWQWCLPVQIDASTLKISNAIDKHQSASTNSCWITVHLIQCQCIANNSVQLTLLLLLSSSSHPSPTHALISKHFVIGEQSHHWLTVNNITNDVLMGHHLSSPNKQSATPSLAIRWQIIPLARPCMASLLLNCAQVLHLQMHFTQCLMLQQSST